MSTTQITLLTLAAVAYLTVGLFVSRHYWRSQVRRGSDIELLSFGVVLVWPLTLFGMALGRFVKWFYGDWR